RAAAPSCARQRRGVREGRLRRSARRRTALARGTRCPMTALQKVLSEYLTLRRGLGTELFRPGIALSRFVDFLEREGAAHITRDLALRWATEPANAQPA